MSTLRVNTLQNAAGTGQPAMSGAAKAWVNFNGTGTVAIRASFNVTSITDNGTGDYTVNFTSAMADADYMIGSCAWEWPGVNGGAGFYANSSFYLASSIRGKTYNTSNVAVDANYCHVAIFR